MRDYRVFGGHLRTEIEFPGLPEASGRVPTWTLEAGRSRPLLMSARLLGEDDLDDGTVAQLYRCPGGYRLRSDESGTWDLSPDGRRITWHQDRGATPAAARLDVLRRVLPFALHLGGTLCLRGAAVTVDGGALAFLSARRGPEALLALSLVRAGARLLADDLVAVESGPPPVALPGVHFRRRSRPRAPQTGGLPRPSLIDDVPGPSLAVGPSPLRAVYVLHTDPHLPGPARVTRHRVPPLAAGPALARHSRLGDILQGEAPLVTARAASLVDTVPVFSLRLSADPATGVEAALKLLHWHGSRAASPSGRAVSSG